MGYSEPLSKSVMPILWLRVALGFYAVGLLYALVALTRTSELLGKVALHAAYSGHGVSFRLADGGRRLSGQITPGSVHNSESLLAFLIMMVFMIIYLRVQDHLARNYRFPNGFLVDFCCGDRAETVSR